MSSAKQELPELPVPQSGWHLDRTWAIALGESVKTFRAKVRKFDIPYIAWESTMLVQAEDYFGHAPREDYGEEEEP